MKNLVIYHGACDDGFGAALAAKLHFGDTAEYVAGFYGQPPPDVAGKDVFILDFSYNRQVMEGLGRAAKSITLLDHHKSAALELAELRLDCDAIIQFDMEHSGAVLAWKFFFGELEVPWLFLFIEDNDLWRFKIPGTRAFIRNLRSYPQDFKVWSELLDSLENPRGQDDFVSEGGAQERFFNAQIDFLLLHTKPQEIILGSNRGLAINAPKTFCSDAGHRLAGLSKTFGATYIIQGDGTVSFSLRSVGDFDVSLIAKLYGGGGHRNAAGFETSKEVLLRMLSPSVDNDPFGAFTE